MSRTLPRSGVGACVRFALGAALFFPPRAALAQDIVAAEALFQEGRALLEKGAYDEACSKLAESERLDASSGTALNLASCHEHQGKLATAWAEYLLASRLARAQGHPDRQVEAKTRAAELEPGLSTLTIQATEVLPGLEIRRDDAVLAASSIGSKIPVDPGVHRIVVSAPGHEPVSLDVTVGAKADAQVVTLPKLLPSLAKSDVPKASPAAMRQPRPTLAKAVPNRPKKTPWLIVGGAGATLAVAGGVFGVLALTSYHAANRACPTHVGCDPDAVADRDRAGTFANVANLGVGFGLVGIGAAVAMWLSADESSGSVGTRAKASRPRVTPEFGPGNAAVKISGSFQ